MRVEQLHTLVNEATGEVLGKQDLVQKDLSNLVDIGDEIISTHNMDNYVKTLVNHIGKVIFADRIYKGGVPSVLMDSWEYGSILQKVSTELPEAKENDSWNLQDGEDYSPDVFYQPKVSAKFFNHKITFEINLSFTELQVKESFSNAEQLNGFISMLHTSVENSMTVKLDNLIMNTINNMIGETLVADLPKTEAGKTQFAQTGVKAVNLLKLYNDEYGEKLTKEKALATPEFIRHSSYVIGLYTDRMNRISTVFNIGAKEKFTPSDMLHVVLLSDFEKASNVFLNSDVYHNELTSLPQGIETVPFWQGSGKGYEFGDISKIDIKTASGDVVATDGILGVMFDRDAIGVANLDRRVTTNYNARAEFYNNFYKFDAGYYNDMNENFVVFYVA